MAWSGLPTRSLFLAILIPPALWVGGSAVQADDDELDPWILKGFVIIRCTTDHADAVRVAEVASRGLSVPVDLRGLIYDPVHGLTWPREQCAKAPLYPYPCHPYPYSVARGRFDSGVSLSVERPDACATFQPGDLIVILATGAPVPPGLASALTLAEPQFPDAYLETEPVYHGCMHSYACHPASRCSKRGNA